MASFEKDPVCGMMVDPAQARHETLAQQDYCFCSNMCRNRFLVNPGRYLDR
jgi:YHS domain-containing protein